MATLVNEFLRGFVFGWHAWPSLLGIWCGATLVVALVFFAVWAIVSVLAIVVTRVFE